MGDRRKGKNALLMVACAAGLLFLSPPKSVAQIHAPNFQLGLPLDTGDHAFSDLHSDRTPELHVNTLLKQGKVDEALKDIDDLLQKHPDRSVLWLMRAYAHELKGQYADALQDFDKAQKNCGDELANDKRMGATLLLFKGIALHKVGKNQDALVCFDKVIEMGGDPAAYYARGLVYQDLFQNSKAIENFNEALKDNPGNPAWLEGRAFSYCTIGEFEKALKDCDRAAEIAPSHLVYETRAWAQHGLHHYDKSIEDADRSLAIAPDSVIAYWRRGLAHLAQGKSKEAVADFDKGHSIKPSSLLLRDRALAEVDLHQYDKAIEDATEAMSELHREAQPYRIRALAYFATGEYKKALDDWNSAIRLEPDDPYTFARRGSTYVAIGEWEKALTDYETAERKGGATIALHTEKSRAYRHMKKLPEALKECDAAIKENPKDEAAFEARARVRLAQWLNDDALKDADTAIGIANDSKWIGPAEVKALVYSQREQWLKELAECDRSIAANPDECAMYIHRAYADHRLGDYKKAIADLDQAVKLEPSADNYAARADARLYVGDIDGAITDANESLKKDSDNSYGYMARGAAYGKKGEREKMVSDFSKGLKLDKEPAYAHATVAEYYMDMQFHDDAIKEYSAAIEGEPNNAQLYRWRGQALLNAGKTEEALKDFDKAISMESFYPVAYAFRADALIKQGEFDKAIADCNKAINLDDTCVIAYRNRAIAHEKLGKRQEADADRELAAKIGK